MKSISTRSGWRALGVVGATFALAIAMTACGAGNESDDNSGDSSGGDALSGNLAGSGATSQESAMQSWVAGIQGDNPDLTIDYDAAGSGAGREAFIAGGVQFAGSDSYMSDDELASAEKTCGGPAYEFPVYVSPIAVIYNLDGVDDLQLSPETLADIFAGKITKWNDSAIATDNPDADLPNEDIHPTHRSDESGTTANFTDYLAKAAPSNWTYGSVDTWPMKSGEAAEGTSGVVAAVTAGAGSIGYADASQAGDLGKALIKVGSSYVGPTADAASKVLDESDQVPGRDATDLAIDVNRTTDGDGVYPVILISYHIVCSHYADQNTVDLVKAFESYVISTDGQDAAAKVGSAPITDALRTKAQAAIDAITTK